MLINLKKICELYEFVPAGIIHIGAHTGEESNQYKELNIDNIIWIEANPEIFNQLKLNVESSNITINALLSNIDDALIPFYVTNNGESSSLLKMDKHKIHHPSIFVEREINLKTSTFKTIVQQYNLDLTKYDFINLDVQGAELLVLKGFENFKNIKYIYTEVNESYLYSNCVLINELDDYLQLHGFHRVLTEITEYEWGDAFYIKTDLVFDIGSNKGDYCNNILNTCNTNTNIICVEANPNLIELLQNRFINDNVKILNYAVSNESNKNIDFFICDTDTISTASLNWIENSRFSKNYSWNKKIQVPTITLDQLISLYGIPSIIKIDVEGYELEVIKGLTQKVNEICFEWAEEDKFNVFETCKYLNELGYNLFGIINEDDYNNKPNEYFSYMEFIHIIDNFNINRKTEWGMIYVK